MVVLFDKKVWQYSKYASIFSWNFGPVSCFGCFCIKILAAIYRFKDSNGNPKTMWEICSKLIIKTPEQHKTSIPPENRIFLIFSYVLGVFEAHFLIKTFLTYIKKERVCRKLRISSHILKKSWLRLVFLTLASFIWSSISITKRDLSGKEQQLLWKYLLILENFVFINWFDSSWMNIKFLPWYSKGFFSVK